MKRIIQYLSLALVLGFIACEDQSPDWYGNESMEVSQEHGNALKSLFPEASFIEWELESAYYVASFREDGHEKSAWFDSDACWEMTEIEYAYKLLPEIIQEFINENYSQRKVEIEKIERPRFTDAYLLEEDNKETLLLETGLIIDESLNGNLSDIVPVELTDELISVLESSIPDFSLAHVELGNCVWKIILLDANGTPFGISVNQDDYTISESKPLSVHKEN